MVLGLHVVPLVYDRDRDSSNFVVQIVNKFGQQIAENSNPFDTTS